MNTHTIKMYHRASPAVILFVLALSTGCSENPQSSDPPPPTVVALSFTTDNWEGAGWCYNNGPHSWFPSVSGAVASFARDDYCWGQARTRDYIEEDQEVSFEIQPFLTTGGVNEDGVMIGFCDGWAFYQGRFVGVRFQRDSIYLYDHTAGEGLPPSGAPVIGTFTEGEWVSLTMKVTSDGVFEITGAGVDHSYTIDNMWSQFRFNIGMNDSVDGVKAKNVTVQ